MQVRKNKLSSLAKGALNKLWGQYRGERVKFSEKGELVESLAHLDP